jgi:6-phosphofructokinase 2
MRPIATLTLNPAIDISSEADNVRPTQKTRIFGERIEPGGGGVNVARALAAFDAPVRAIYLAGGSTGRALDHMLELRGIERTCIRIAGDTRMSLTVHDRSTGEEYRFVPEGPEVPESAWRACLDEAERCGCGYLIASGSLPRGVPDDFYAMLGTALRGGDVRFVLDTSGAELKTALDQGGLFLIKPSHGELAELAGRRLDDIADVRAFALELVGAGRVEHVAVTMGDKGALLASAEGDWFLPAVEVEVRSAVGAGDSFVAAMTYGFASGLEAKQAFRLGVAAGAAAVRAPGMELCNAEDVKRLLEQVPQL